PPPMVSPGCSRRSALRERCPLEVVTVVRLLRKWLWLLILAGVLAGASAYLLRRSQAGKYKASVMIAVGTTLESPNPDFSFLTAGAQLARTYVILARTHEVLDATVVAGKFP